MFLAWVEVRATKSQPESDRATRLGNDSDNSTINGPGTGPGGPAEARPVRVPPCDLVEKEFPALSAAREWASEQLVKRPDVTGNVAVFETVGPLVRLVWRPGSVPASPNRARHRRQRLDQD